MGLILTEQQVTAADDMAAWGAEAIHGLQVTELRGQSERTARLMARAAEAEQRELKLADLLHEQQRLCSAQDARIRQLEHEVKLLRGQIYPAGTLDEGEFSFEVQVGTATNYARVWVSAIQHRPDHRSGGYTAANALWINGEWISVADVADALDPCTLDEAADRQLKIWRQNDDDSRAEDQARYMEGA